MLCDLIVDTARGLKDDEMDSGRAGMFMDWCARQYARRYANSSSAGREGVPTDIRRCERVESV